MLNVLVREYPDLDVYKTTVSCHAPGMAQLPPLGDSQHRSFTIGLTEAEVNSLYAGLAFIKAAGLEAGKHFTPWAVSTTEWWKHYGPTLETLLERLGKFDGQLGGADL